MNIKTVTTYDGVNVVDFGSAASRFYWFQNIGTTTVYVSGNSDISAGGDGVAELPSGGSVCIETFGGKVYVLGAGKVQIHNTGDKFCPFKNAPAQSGGGTIDAYTKTESDAKYAQKTDIPSSLPANGGNADTAKTLSDFLGVWQENLDDAPLGFCNAHGGTVNTPFEFWSTVITVGHDENYRQQIAFPWAEGESYIMPKFRVMDNGVWYSWKQCNPIRSTNISGSTDEHGSLLLWSGSGSIPIAAVGDGNRVFSPFIGSENNYYLAVRDMAGNAIANTTASATVFFI